MEQMYGINSELVYVVCGAILEYNINTLHTFLLPCIRQQNNLE